MSDLNPYAPPSGEPAFPKEKRKYKGVRKNKRAAVWREGDQVVVDLMDAELPDRCVVCNAPADGYKLRKRFLWHHPSIVALVCPGLFLYFIGGLFGGLFGGLRDG